MTHFAIEVDVNPSLSFLPGLSTAQRIFGPDVGAGPRSEGHGQRNPQTPLPDKGGSTVLHRPSHETEQDEMRRAAARPPGRGRRHRQVQMEQITPVHRGADLQGRSSRAKGRCFG